MTERFEPARKGNLKDLAVVVAIDGMGDFARHQALPLNQRGAAIAKRGPKVRNLTALCPCNGFVVENMTVNRLSTDLNPSFAALQVV